MKKLILALCLIISYPAIASGIPQPLGVAPMQIGGYLIIYNTPCNSPYGDNGREAVIINASGYQISTGCAKVLYDNILVTWFSDNSGTSDYNPSYFEWRKAGKNWLKQ